MSLRFPSIDRTLVVECLMRSYPIVFSTLNVLALEAVNTIMISQIGMRHVASAVFANTLFNIFKKINSGISVSVSLLVARADREKNYKRVTNILKHALLLNTFFALTFFVILIGLSCYMEPYMKFASQSPEIFPLGRPYLLIISISLIPSAVNNMVRRYLEGICYGKIGLLLGFFTLFTNVIFNFLLIYGKCGFPALGLQGAGIAMVCAETLTAVAGMLYLVCILRPNGYLMSFKFDQISWRDFKEILWVGWPAGIQFGIEGAYLFFIAMVVGWIGVEAQAAHAILFNLCQLITIFAVGLGISGSMLVAQQRGTQNGLVRKIALAAYDMIKVFSIIIGLTFLTISPYIISFYKPVYAVKCLVSSLIKHLCLFQLFYGVCYWGNSVLRGLDDRALPFVCNVITQFAGAIICYILVIRYHWGISGVWLTLIFERMLLGLLLFSRFEYKTRRSV